LQVYETPDVDLPIAPAGEQNAPGVTINELLLSTGVGVGAITGAGVGVAEGIAEGVVEGVVDGVVDGVTTGVGVTNGVGVGVTVGVALNVGVALTTGVGVGVFETPRPQELINEFNFVASFASTVKEYLVFIAIQF